MISECFLSIYSFQVANVCKHKRRYMDMTEQIIGNLWESTVQLVRWSRFKHRYLSIRYLYYKVDLHTTVSFTKVSGEEIGNEKDEDNDDNG